MKPIPTLRNIGNCIENAYHYNIILLYIAQASPYVKCLFYMKITFWHIANLFCANLGKRHEGVFS